MEDRVYLVSNYGGLLWADHVNQSILIDDFMQWLEEFIVISLIHEIIHLVLDKIEDIPTSRAFDNIFGLLEPSIILYNPEIKSEYYNIMLDRLSRMPKNISKLVSE